MNAHVIQSQIKEVCLKTAWHARPQTRTQDVYPELQNFVLENFCTVLLKILLSLRDSTHLILDQTQVNVREGHTAVGCLGISEFWTISDWTELGLVELSLSSFLSAVMSFALFSFFAA